MRSWIRRTIGIVGFLALIVSVSVRRGETNLPGGIDGILELVGMLFLVALCLYLIFNPTSRE